MESLYVGIGSLYISNNYDYVYRNVNDFSTYGEMEDNINNADPIFKDNTSSLIFPSINIGTVLPLFNQFLKSGPVLSVVANAQLNFAQNDVLDAYTPYNSSGNLYAGKNDMYNFYSLGLRYSF